MLWAMPWAMIWAMIWAMTWAMIWALTWAITNQAIITQSLFQIVVHLITVSRAEGLDGKEVLLRRSDADSLGATPSAVRGIYVHWGWSWSFNYPGLFNRALLLLLLLCHYLLSSPFFSFSFSISTQLSPSVQIIFSVTILIQMLNVEQVLSRFVAFELFF